MRKRRTNKRKRLEIEKESKYAIVAYNGGPKWQKEETFAYFSAVILSKKFDEIHIF